MSYPRGLDEYGLSELLRELKRRAKLASHDRCDYCERSTETPPCRFPARHLTSAAAWSAWKEDAKYINNCLENRRG